MGAATGSAVIGVDVGASVVKAVLTDSAASVISELREETPPPGGDVSARVADVVSALVSALRSDATVPVSRVGLVVPGIIDEVAGVAVDSANLGWHGAPLREAAAARLGLPVAFGHDVRAGGLAEARLGAARGSRDVVFVPVGTGISASILLGGRLHAAGGYAGELGHVDVGHDERCRCGRSGCLEAMASAAAIARRYQARTGRPARGADDVADRALEGDPDAIGVWSEAVGALALALAWVTSVLAPEVIVIGGGLSKAGDLLLIPLSEQLESRLRFERRPRLVRGALGDRAGCLGAALLALDAERSAGAATCR